MAANPAFKKVMINNVSLDYPRLDATYRFNSQEQRSEQCNPTAQGAAWSVSWTMSAEDAKALFKDLKDHYNDCRKRDTSLPEFGTIFGMKRLDNSLVSFRAKRSGTNRNGEPNKAPLVIDAYKQPLENKAIWTGSTGTLRVIAFPSKSPQTGQGGISLLLDVVQVAEAVYGGDTLDDFEGAAPAADNSLDDFGLPPVKSEPAPKKAPAVDDLDDLIPF
jgi:hypothetical protein